MSDPAVSAVTGKVMQNYFYINNLSIKSTTYKYNSNSWRQSGGINFQILAGEQRAKHLSLTGASLICATKS